MSTRVPRLLRGFLDDAAVFPPGNASLPEAVRAHREHRTAWYADVVGPLLVPASSVGDLGALLDPDERLAIGIIGDTGVAGLPKAFAAADPRLEIRQVEAAVAKRGEDPQPGLARLMEVVAGRTTYAEIPLTSGLLGALDTTAEKRIVEFCWYCTSPA